MPWLMPGHVFYVRSIPAEVISLKEEYMSPVKINLTLRVLSRRPDGYHEIISMFWKKKGIEGLTIRPHDDENIGDILDIEGTEISGENILFKALRWARSRTPQIPPLKMRLIKKFPAQSGIGAGSGNAAALLTYLRSFDGLDIEDRSLSSVGADVPFLAGDNDLALVGGLGEMIRPQGELKGFRWVIGFPCWRSDTSAAYRGIDDIRRDADRSFNVEKYEKESFDLLRKLRSGEIVGLLPNDFLEVVSKGHPEYLRAFEIAERSGARAWGLSGSGSAFFMIFREREMSGKAISLLDREDWIIKTTELE